MRLLAGLYVALVLIGIMIWLINRTDKYFWHGVSCGLMIAVAYLLFILAVMELIHPMVWR